MKHLFKIILILLVVVLVVVLLLFVCARVFDFGTIGNLLDHFFYQFSIMAERIFS